MTLAIGVGIALVFTIILIVVFVYLVRTMKLFAKQRVGIAYVQGVAVRFTHWEDVDSVRLQRAMTAACNFMVSVWPRATIVEVLDGMHVNVVGVEAWQEPISRREVSGVAYAGLNTILVDKNLKSLAHELAHILEAGRARLPPAGEHAGWEERGIYKAIDSYESWLKSEGTT